MVAINPEPLRRLIEVAINVVFSAMLTRAARNKRNAICIWRDAIARYLITRKTPPTNTVYPD